MLNVEVLHISTANICKIVTAHITMITISTITIKYDVTYELSITIIKFHRLSLRSTWPLELCRQIVSFS